MRISGNTLLATHTDGVGTKVMIACALNKYDTVGIDCVAMNANDIVCVGAAPTSFVDYIAANRNDSYIFGQIVRGLVRGAIEASVPIVGGETAILPDMFGNNEFAFDLAGTITGLVNQDRLILGNDIQVGDIIMGARSSGLHSNGYTLARKVLLSRYSVHDQVRGVGRIGDVLLEPTKIYVKPVLEALKVSTIHGLAHVTGGSFTKLTRLKNVGFEIDSLPWIPPIIHLMAEHDVEYAELYKTFNMGVGLCVIAPPSEVDLVTTSFKRYHTEIAPIGRIIHKKGVTIKSCSI